MSTTMTPPVPDTSFRHEALLYAGEAEFVDRTLPFIRDGLDADEATLVVVDAAKIERLRAALDGDADRVHFTDMAVVGHNPARIIPAWRAFVDEHRGTGRQLRGIGEPISATRSPAELVECQRHESLLNVAFDGAPAWWLVCPYDTENLDAGIIDEARRSHPFMWQGDDHRVSPTCRDLATMAAPVTAPLPEPEAPYRTFSFEGLSSLPLVRSFVADAAVAGGLGAVPTVELVAAVHELVANSVRHGGGKGVLRAWLDRDAVMCEVRDRGHLDQPLAGRESPAVDSDGGRGLWLANQFSDLMQIRSSDAGTVVRVHKSRRAVPSSSTR
ncbi:MAG: sensor histidine kinase [Actinomycetota bacterium]|nr:sensor histidine kinase [Actinomycetota bacterium]